VSFRTSLYTGEVFHRRLRPRIHAMRYRVFSLLIDLDEIDLLASELACFSRNRFNLLSFFDSDFGERSGEPEPEPVKASALARLQEAGLDRPVGRILLSCYPLFAIIHEVHNTFGERHSYVLPVDASSSELNHTIERQWINQSADKALFVSPFAHMEMQYQFRLNRPDERQVVVIRASDKSGTLITASYVANRRELSNRSLFRELLRLPLMTFKVIVGIHFEALRLWIKRVPWFTHVPKNAKKKNVRLRKPECYPFHAAVIPAIAHARYRYRQTIRPLAR